MSLVNDMLRDLDQRRKDTDGSSSRVHLTPAPNTYREERNRIMPYVAISVGLAVVAGLGFLWAQFNSSETTSRELNIRPEVVVAPSESTSVAAEGSPDQPAELAQSIAVSAIVESPVTDQSVVVPAIGIAQSQSAATVEVAPEPPRDSIETSTLDSVSATLIADVIAPETVVAEEPLQLEVEPVQESVLEQAETERVNVINQEPEESVKDVAAMTGDEQDMLAVQVALRLIANSDLIGAYAHLEQFIVNNRYANQSRETYAKLLINAGEYQAAYNLVEAGLELAPNHAGFKKAKARLLIADGQINEAVELLLSRAPDVGEDLEYHDILATAQYASRDYQGALISYTGLVRQDQSQGKWWYGFAASQDSLGNRNAARQAYNQAMMQENLSANLRRRSQERLIFLSQ